MKQRFKINVTEANMLLDYPRACLLCDFPAVAIILEEIPGTMEGAARSLIETECICIEHLTYEHMMIESIQ
jgi:hypothetical protein